MANEATINLGFSIIKTGLTYRPASVQFRVDVDGAKGPSPGAITVSTYGTDVDFSQLITPGLCLLTNLDTVNYVEYGIYNGVEFYPLGEIGPGETYPLKLSRNLLEAYIGTGTGTDAVGASSLRIKANTASCDVVVAAFER